MNNVKIIYWQDGAQWLGYLQEYPEYMTQGSDLHDLQEHLQDIWHEIQAGTLPGARKMMELAMP
ncbi:MAG: type II toxin-antitoxin system HicB family antitoxin [bacterium]|nr:type II toxin-antitoxin system HicB family antitoxin [bacterium]